MARPLEAGDDVAALHSRIRRLEAERDAALRLAEARARWLAHVSHELRTPMNGILGMTRLALETDLSPERREHLDLVRRSAHALMTLINDTLDHAKLSAGKLAFELIPLDLRDAIEVATKMMEPAAAAKGISLDLEIDAALPARLVGDPSRLRQVIYNLVGNAIKFTVAGGVVVSICQVERGATECAVRFRVRDTGIGIPADRPWDRSSSRSSRRPPASSGNTVAPASGLPFPASWWRAWVAAWK